MSCCNNTRRSRRNDTCPTGPAGPRGLRGLPGDAAEASYAMVFGGVTASLDNTPFIVPPGYGAYTATAPGTALRLGVPLLVDTDIQGLAVQLGAALAGTDDTATFVVLVDATPVPLATFTIPFGGLVGAVELATPYTASAGSIIRLQCTTNDIIPGFSLVANVTCTPTPAA